LAHEEHANPATDRRVAVDAGLPWRWCRAAVMLLVAIDATARLEWDDAGVGDQAA
jgi:hypothetical protein